MKTRFFLMTALICLLLVAWVWLEQQYENARLEKYRQLSDLPVYIYVADSSRVAPLMERLAEFPQLRDINLETGLQAADELVQAYQLPISTGSLADYRFPIVITLLFKPLRASVEVKPAVMRAIAEQQIELTDIDAQSNAWGQTVKELARPASEVVELYDHHGCDAGIAVFLYPSQLRVSLSAPAKTPVAFSGGRAESLH
jgi:hypothetical protein